MAEQTEKYEEMVWVPGGRYQYQATHRFREGGFVLYDEGPLNIEMAGYFIDRYEVTNAQFKKFLDATGYEPAVKHNFLRHWQNGFPEALADHPVVSAQGEDGRKWPWGNEFDPAKCNSDSSGTTPVDAFPSNTSPYGVTDMVGNVWEWIDVVASEGWHNWCFLRGGSYHVAKGSMWYVEGGAQPTHHHHKFLLMNPSVDRCGTVGFRCVKSEGRTMLRAYDCQW